MLMEQEGGAGASVQGVRSLDADGSPPSSTDCSSFALPNMPFLSVVLDHALVNRQEPAIGALYHRVRLLVADEPDIVPNDVPERLTRFTRDIMFDIPLVENAGRNPSAPYDAIERFPRDAVAGN
jgi:hypothetical protein